MTEEQFKTVLPRIQEVIKFALDNKYSDFYREKYKNLDFDPLEISSYEEFKKLPLLHKDELLKIPMTKRCFIPEVNIASFNLTSGTTSNNKPLAVPITKDSNPLDRISSLKDVPIKNERVLVLFPPMSAAFAAYNKSVPRFGGIPIAGDVHGLKKTAVVAVEVGVSAIITTPTILDFFLRELKTIKFDLDKIKIISLGGENTSAAKHVFFQNNFKKAKIYFRYGAAETGGLRGFRCKYLFDRGPDVYHPAEVMLEVLDYHNAVLKENEAGELIYTDLRSPRGFPFIRYQTGDIGKVLSEKCKCGQAETLYLGGRTSFDILKFGGVTLYAKLVEDSLMELNGYLESFFQVHVSEVNKGGNLMPQLELWVIPKEKTKNEIMLEELINRHVSKTLYLSEDKNLEYFIQNNIFLPLKIKFVPKKYTQSKSKKIVSHL
jgi:phenylacetate-CoA ligase